MGANRVLIVDDDRTTIEMLRSLLLLEGYEVDSATYGEAALRKVLTTAPPDLILLDIMLPGLDGHDVARAIRSIPGAADLPIIFLTARRSLEDEQLALEEDGFALLHKPFVCRELLEKVRVAISRPRSPA
ncbi:MAG: response regulator [Planctomycetes bacterium]|nr:response regulator [Planctomycetota bacterium]